MIGANFSALEGRLIADRGDGQTLLRPQLRFFANPPTNTNETAILTDWDGQLYTVLGQPDGTGRWQLRLWWKPFVTLIWGGWCAGRDRRRARARRTSAARTTGGAAAAR